jgi:hypothetical protein
MNKTKKIIQYIDKIANMFEFAIAFLLLIIIAVNVIELLSEIAGSRVVLINMSFETILSSILILVIGLEFIKMLCKHTPESVIDVLLFVIARFLVIYHENAIDMVVGVIAIVGLFAARKYFVERKDNSL